MSPTGKVLFTYWDWDKSYKEEVPFTIVFKDKQQRLKKNSTFMVIYWDSVKNSKKTILFSYSFNKIYCHNGQLWADRFLCLFSVLRLSLVARKDRPKTKIIITFVETSLGRVENLDDCILLRLFRFVLVTFMILILSFHT